MNSARITHTPTGMVRQAQTRSRENSRQEAMSALQAALDLLSGNASGQAENQVRRAHVGSGERSDRRRTYQFQNNIVSDHITNKKASTKKIMAGYFDLLW